MEIQPITRLRPSVEWTQGNIRVMYEAMNVDLSETDGWPPYLTTRPMVGEMVESTSGRRLAVKDIIHTIDNRKATLKIVLGRDDGGITPMEGGEMRVEMEPE